MTIILAVKSGLLLVVLAMSLYYDVKEQKIKNFITVPAAGIGLLLNILDQGYAGLILSIQGWIVPVVVLMFFYVIGTMGAGDIKLFAAIGAIMGLPFVVNSFVFSVFIGGVIAVVLLVWRRVFLERMRNLFAYFKLVLITRSISRYSDKDDRSSKFIFTTAIIPGTVLQLCIMILQIAGVLGSGREFIWF